MKTQVTQKAVINLVQNVIESKPFAEKNKHGVYLQKNNERIYITFGDILAISVFHNGFCKKILFADRHDSMIDAEKQAKNFIEEILEILDSVANKK